MRKKIMSLLLTVAMLLSVVSPVMAEDGTSTPEQLPAPELKYSLGINTITLDADGGYKSSDVQTEYAMYNGASWNEWQQGATFPELETGKTYQFKARYKSLNSAIYTDSPESEVIEVVARDDMEVTFRLIGSTLPNATVNFNTAPGEYNGAEYRTWIKTTPVTLDEEATAEALITKILADTTVNDQGITKEVNANKQATFYAPKDFGSYALSKDSNKINNVDGNSYSRWSLTIIRNGVSYDSVTFWSDRDRENNTPDTAMLKSGSSSSAKSITKDLHHGDQVIVSFNWAKDYEMVSGSKYSADPRWGQNAFKAPDLSVAEYIQMEEVVAAIDAIGRVTRDSGVAIRAARSAYDALVNDIQRGLVDESILTRAEAIYATLPENGAAEIVLDAPVLQSSNFKPDSYSITVDSTITSAQDAGAKPQYRISADGTSWSEWQDEPMFDGLQPLTTYYIQARFYTSNAVVYADSPAGSAVAVKTLVGNLDAPVLNAKEATRETDKITLAVPQASKQDPEAVLQYRISDDGENWSDWQTSPEFTGLTKDTTYYFEARYVSSDTEAYLDSFLSEVVAISTISGEWINFRVIGGTMPTSKIEQSKVKVGDYSGAEYQNWLKTTKVDLPSDKTKLNTFLPYALEANDFTYALLSSKSYVNTPSELGDYTLVNTDGKLLVSNSRWYITVYHENQTIGTDKPAVEKEFKTGTTDSLQDGDTVILHFTYYYYNTELYGKTNPQNYLKVLDWNASQHADLNEVITLIDAIGEVELSREPAIIAARAAYEAADEEVQACVTNIAILTAAETRLKELKDAQNTAVTMDPPVFSNEGGTATGATVTLAAPAASVVEGATIQYRMSADSKAWSDDDWQESNVFTGLENDTTYYFQARYKSPDLTKYNHSEPSNTVAVTTNPPQIAEVKNREEWDAIIKSAPVDGSDVIIKIVEDVTISTGMEGIYATQMPAGTDITMVGAGGKLIGTGGGENNEGIWVSENCTLTLKDLTYYAIGPMAESEKHTNNSTGSMIKFTGQNAVVNLENITMYGDVSTKAIFENRTHNGITASKNTVNIYSGTFVQVQGKKLLSGNETTVNLIPKGDIILDGQLATQSNVNLIPQEGSNIKGVSIRTSEAGSYNDVQLAGGQIDTSYCYGLRVIVSEGALLIPTEKLNAPSITVDDIVVNVNQVTIPYRESTQDVNAKMQVRWKMATASWGQYNVWRTPPISFDPVLEENTEYTFQVRYKTIGGNYFDSDALTFTVKTGYKEIALDAPILGEAAEKTETSITLTPVAASVQDNTAVAQYRISVDGKTWDDNGWTTELVFAGLNSGTSYYFQARYYSETVPYVPSEASNTLEVVTKVAAVLYGDVDGNGEVNQQDAALLQQYLAKYTVEIHTDKADVNLDGAVNLADYIILRRYLMDWDGYGTLPYIPAQ